MQNVLMHNEIHSLRNTKLTSRIIFCIQSANLSFQCIYIVVLILNNVYTLTSLFMVFCCSVLFMQIRINAANGANRWHCILHVDFVYAVRNIYNQHISTQNPNNIHMGEMTQVLVPILIKKYINHFKQILHKLIYSWNKY